MECRFGTGIAACVNVIFDASSVFTFRPVICRTRHRDCCPLSPCDYNNADFPGSNPASGLVFEFQCLRGNAPGCRHKNNSLIPYDAHVPRRQW
jgi:hypothetical protein